MAWVHVVLGLALAQFAFFCGAVSRARTRYEVPAPACAGNEMFERYFRVQMNTLEQLTVFVPSLMLFAWYVNAYVAAGLGLVFVIGRFVYFSAYIQDPKRRSVGFGLSAIPNAALLVGSIIGAATAALHRY